jgi:outer membrane protein TolC
MAEGEVVALVYNPDLRVARLKAGVAKATAEHAGRWDDPELSIDVLKVTEGVPSPWVVGSALSLTIPISGRLQVEKSRAEAAAHSELARVAEEEWKTLTDLRKAWLTWSANRLRLEETERIVGSLDSVVETTGQLAEAGELPRTESALFKIEQESRKADVARLRGQVNEGEQEIRSLLGISPTAPAKLVPTLASTSGKERSKLEESNPTLIRLQSDYAVSELTLLREIRKQYPDLQLGPQYEDDQGQSKIGMIGAIPIPILNSNKGGIAAARAEREVARAAFETELERAEGRLAGMRARLEGTRSRRQSINSNIVPLVDRQIEDAQRLLELGESGSLVLLESLVRAHEAKLDLIEVRLEESTTQTDIRHLLGPDRLAATTK